MRSDEHRTRPHTSPRNARTLRASALTATTVAMLLVWPLTTWAGRPLQTEDAGVLDVGACEFESFYGRIKLDGESAKETSVQFGCGVGARTQVALAAAEAKAAGERERSLAVVGKTSLWRLGTADDAPAFTLAWGLGWSKPDGASLRHAETTVNLVYTAPALENTVWHANLGHARDERAHQRNTTWGLALEHEGFGSGVTLAPMVELFGDDREKPWWNVGLRATLQPDRVFVDASYGRQLGNGKPTLVTVGVKVAF